MKYYRGQVSGRLICQIFKTGTYSDFGEKIEVESGLPQNASLIMVRMANTPDVLDMLFVTDEKPEKEIPEAVDVWEWAERCQPQVTVHTKKD